MSFLLPIILGFLNGMVVGMTGVGGGVIILPTLTAVFRLPTVAAIASAFVFAIASRIGALITHNKLGNVKFKLGLIMGFSGLPAILITSWLLGGYKQMPAVEQGIRVAFVVVVAGCILSMVTQKPVKERDDRELLGDDAPNAEGNREAVNEQPVPILKAVLGSSVAGIVIGGTSIGGGVLIIPMLSRFFQCDIRRAVGTSLLISNILALAGALVLFGDVNFKLVALLLIGALPGASIGARLSDVFSAKTLRRMVITLMIVAAGAIFL